VAGGGLVFGAIYTLISLPLSYYEGFILPHRYGQSNEVVKGWFVDQLKGMLIGAVLGG
jgi:STE24 endopeptidase